MNIVINSLFNPLGQQSWQATQSSGSLHISFKSNQVHSVKSSNHCLPRGVLPHICPARWCLPGFPSLSSHAQSIGGSPSQHYQAEDHTSQVALQYAYLIIPAPLLVNRGRVVVNNVSRKISIECATSELMCKHRISNINFRLKQTYSQEIGSGTCEVH